MTTLRQALEAALLDQPDDVATHMAYADHLLDQGDPRGEFIQVQLALEDPARSPARREALRRREAELLEQHQRAWLGEEVADLFAGRGANALMEQFGFDYVPHEPFELRFTRGWVEQLRLETLNGALAAALGRSPALRLLRDLSLGDGCHDEDALDEVAAWPCMAVLRRFQFGPEDNCHVTGASLAAPIARMTRIEELLLNAHATPAAEVFALTLPHLRVLQVHHLNAYPLEVLAANPSLGNLTTLRCWPHALEPGDDAAYLGLPAFRALVRSPYLKRLSHLALYLSDIGDAGIEALVESGMLRQLRVLDLWSGRISDVGAGRLAACPDLKHLERLRLAQNALTADGIAVLRATGVPLEADQQFTAAAIDEREHLWEGDIE